MPELPEVETIRAQLDNSLPITIVSINKSRYVNSILKEVELDLVGSKLTKVERYGKWLIFNLDRPGFILGHLGMSGSWAISTQKIKHKHNHFQLHGVNDEGKIVFNYIDPRRFGFIYIVGKSRRDEIIGRLGVDISSKEFTENYVKMVISKCSDRRIKELLLEQRYFAGSGNYIANEICARAKVRPTRRCKSLTLAEMNRIYQSVSEVLDQSLALGGVTFQGGYQDAYGEKGEGVKNLAVFYQKICQMCKITQVKKITLAQRGTYYCPHCQK